MNRLYISNDTLEEMRRNDSDVLEIASKFSVDRPCSNKQTGNSFGANSKSVASSLNIDYDDSILDQAIPLLSLKISKDKLRELVHNSQKIRNLFIKNNLPVPNNNATVIRFVPDTKQPKTKNIKK